jgi:hypothetical protein
MCILTAKINVIHSTRRRRFADVLLTVSPENLPFDEPEDLLITNHDRNWVYDFLFDEFPFLTELTEFSKFTNSVAIQKG